jgi:hypothetical protein
MKKYALGSLAIIMAIAMSAFTTHKQIPKKSQTQYIWFNVNDGSGDLSSLTDSDVTFNSSLSSAPSSNPQDCPTSATYNCVVGFNSNQVDQTGQHLKPGAQAIQSVAYERNTE